LGHDTSSVTTNAGDWRVLGVAYDANGNAYSTNSGGGSQTPWAQDINANYFSVSNVGNIAGGGFVLMDQVLLYPDSNEVGLAISPLTGAGNLVEVQTTNSAAALYVTPNGNVGIKTNAPSAALEVQGGLRVSHGITNSGGASLAAGLVTVSTAGRIDSARTYASTFLGVGTSALLAPSNPDGSIQLSSASAGVFKSLQFNGNGTISNSPSGFEFSTGTSSTPTNVIAGGYILKATNTVTAIDGLTFMGAQLWTDGTNLCVVLQNSGGTRTTNKLSMTAWP
jgi:hypothetical protein